MPRSCGCVAMTGVCSMVLLAVLLLSQLGIGVKYIRYTYCPGQPFIPIYLIIMGGAVLLLFLKHWNLICFSVLAVFYLCWFIAGNVCIYMLYNMEFRNCNETLYLFAFWSTNLTYALLAVIFCVVCYEHVQPDGDSDELTPLQV